MKILTSGCWRGYLVPCCGQRCCLLYLQGQAEKLKHELLLRFLFAVSLQTPAWSTL